MQLDQLLLAMHTVGSEFEASSDVVLHRWGLHLLEDWRSLELLAAKLEEPEPL